MPTHHRTLWVSDVHLGSPGCQAERLSSFLRANSCEQLYLVGDIVDGWKLKSRFFWPPAHTAVIQALVEKTRGGTQVSYLAGNHDEFLRPYAGAGLNLGLVFLGNEAIHTTADGRRLLVLHGDSFDGVMRHLPRVAHMGDVGYELLRRANPHVNRLRLAMGRAPISLSNYAKKQVTQAVRLAFGFERRVIARCLREGLDGMVSGHVHCAEIRALENAVHSYNCGDWVESCTALAEDFQGNIRIIQVPAPRTRKKPSRSAAASRAARFTTARSIPESSAKDATRPQA